MIIASARIIPLPDKRIDVLEILRHVQNRMRASSGCISCTIYEEDGETAAILYLELWRSQEELQRHIQSPLYLQILTAIDLASELPEIRFDEVANSQGLELIEALRGCD